MKQKPLHTQRNFYIDIRDKENCSMQPNIPKKSLKLQSRFSQRGGKNGDCMLKSKEINLTVSYNGPDDLLKQKKTSDYISKILKAKKPLIRPSLLKDKFKDNNDPKNNIYRKASSHNAIPQGLASLMANPLSKSLTINNDIKQPSQTQPNEQPQLQIKRTNPQIAEDYIDDIYLHLKTTQNDFPINANYMEDKQNDINDKMRVILLDWMVDLHEKYKLVPETYYLSVNILDRYLSKKCISRSKLQLLGITSMFIASKYEDIYAPEGKDFVYMTDDAYVLKQLLEMEIDVMKELEYNVTIVTPYRFVEMYKQYLKLDDMQFMAARLICLMAVIDYKSLKYLPSILALSAVYIAMKSCCTDKNGIYDEGLVKEDEIWKVTGYCKEDIVDCVKFLVEVFEKGKESKYQAARNKFASSRYLKVSKCLKVCKLGELGIQRE